MKALEGSEDLLAVLRLHSDPLVLDAENRHAVDGLAGQTDPRLPAVDGLELVADEVLEELGQKHPVAAHLGEQRDRDLSAGFLAPGRESFSFEGCTRTVHARHPP